ncbi:D-lactate dehydrogenase [Gloeomargarita lithophora Alchichica-D10]|uniref:D-lactate dehydrogenase n=1 Tax=Gloeomargarita lithophora Alchichica-D10 TaxID=1188229 RepID=A0A1J0AFW6_9CYAN|nr:2-hydroxyacid dehydrogenase [Gloeomargarita lithophora]APB34813.1 D-lactate dehydrogenase [Gloeomargarita lithophora Alchichica-D10]
MKVAVFSSKSYDKKFLNAANQGVGHELVYYDPKLDASTAPLVGDALAVCVFVNDVLDLATLEILKQMGVKLIALRCTGFNNVDLKVAGELGLIVVRVTAYSPYSVAEHAVGLILTLSRKYHRAFNRVREGNFSLDGLLGFDLQARTVGIIGTGKIGMVLAEILQGFGCRILGYDAYPNQHFGQFKKAEYVTLDELYAQADIISIHCPLLPETHHLINGAALDKMKKDVILINVSRGALIDTEAMIEGLKSQKVGALGLDVYEEEEELFFQDLSLKIIQDDVFQRLLTFPNVLVTGHQAFFTQEALTDIATITISNISDFAAERPCPHEIRYIPKP